MEAAITAPVAGRVSRVVTQGVSPVDGGDLLLVLEPGEDTGVQMGNQEGQQT